jgi:hypothetical protein
MVHRSGKRERARVQDTAGSEPDRARSKVQACPAHEASRTDGFGHHDTIAVAAGEFLLENGVSTSRHGSSGEDAHGLAWPYDAWEMLPG